MYRDSKQCTKNSQLLEEARRRQKERALLSDLKPSQKTWDGWEDQDPKYDQKAFKATRATRGFDSMAEVSEASEVSEVSQEPFESRSSSNLSSVKPAEDFKQFIDREYMQLKMELENLRKCSKPLVSGEFQKEKVIKSNSSYSALPEKIEKKDRGKSESIAAAFAGKFKKAERPSGQKQPFIEVVYKERPTRDREGSESTKPSPPEIQRPNSALPSKNQPLKLESSSIEITPDTRKSPTPVTKRSIEIEKRSLESDKRSDYTQVPSTSHSKSSSNRAASVNTSEKDSRQPRGAWGENPQGVYNWDNRYPPYPNYPYFQYPAMQAMQPMQPIQPMPVYPGGYGANFINPYMNPGPFPGYMQPAFAPQYTPGYPVPFYMNPGQMTHHNPVNENPFQHPGLGSKGNENLFQHPGLASKGNENPFQHPGLDSKGPGIDSQYHQSENHFHSDSDDHEFSQMENQGNILESQENYQEVDEDEGISCFEFEENGKKSVKDLSKRNSNEGVFFQGEEKSGKNENLINELKNSKNSSMPLNGVEPEMVLSQKAVLIEVGVNNKKSLAEIFKEKNQKVARRIHNREDHIPKQDHREKTKEELIEIRKNFVKMPKHESKMNLIEVKIEEKKNSKEPSSQLMERLATGQRVKVTKEEMLKLNKKNYKLLPEVKKKQEEEKKRAEKHQRLQKAKEYEKYRQDERKFKILIDN